MISNESETLESNARRLKRVVYVFPQNDSESNAFFSDLTALLQQAENCHQRAGLPVLLPKDPPGVLPFTAFEQDEIEFPAVMLDTSEVVDMLSGRMRVFSPAAMPRETLPPISGERQALKIVPLSILVRAFSGAIRWVDHTVVTLPEGSITQVQWENLLAKVCRISNLYQHPDGQPQPVIVPSTSEELDDEIRRFRPGRDPKVALVYGGAETQPGLRIALQTDLTPAELSQRLPDPYGFTPADNFRAVYAQHPWDGFLLRIDFIYKSGITPWQTNERIVRDGGRICS